MEFLPIGQLVDCCIPDEPSTSGLKNPVEVLAKSEVTQDHKKQNLRNKLIDADLKEGEWCYTVLT